MSRTKVETQVIDLNNTLFYILTCIQTILKNKAATIVYEYLKNQKRSKLIPPRLSSAAVVVTKSHFE